VSAAPTTRIVTVNWDDPSVVGIDGYLAAGGYEGLRAALAMTPTEVIDLVKTSGLRGRGGAGFPTGVKWSFVPQDTGKPTYVVANFDESEPGTFNNREIIEREPHRFLEGMAIAAYAVQSHLAFVYCRGEFLWPGEILGFRDPGGVREGRVRRVGARVGVRARGRIASRRRRLHLRRGDRASVLARGVPRAAAAASPLPRRRGPVRLAHPDQQRRDPRDRPVDPHAGSRVVREDRHREVARAPRSSASRARWSGPATTSCRSGPRCGRCSRSTPAVCSAGGRLKAWTPGGSSTPLLTEEHLDVGPGLRVDHGRRLALGTGAIIVMDETDCIVEAARRLVQFYAHESCGKCTPCREGTWWVSRVLGRIEQGYGRSEDLPLLDELGENILFKAFCALADGAVSPIQSSLKYFRDEYEAHIAERRCPFTGVGPGAQTPTGSDEDGSGGVDEAGLTEVLT
jgi:NADH-quinone oxidoreductase subunit F